MYREAFAVSEEDNEIISEDIKRKILNLAQNFSAVVKVKGTECIIEHLTLSFMHSLHLCSSLCVYIYILLRGISGNMASYCTSV